jgi:hypothetical protein
MSVISWLSKLLESVFGKIAHTVIATIAIWWISSATKSEFRWLLVNGIRSRFYDCASLIRGFWKKKPVGSDL